MNKIGLLAGSFDPFTLGHYDIASRAAKLFTNLYIGVAADTGGKRCVATLDERAETVRKSVIDLPNVCVCTFDGFLTDFAKEIGATVIVRGIRTSRDLEYENVLSTFYKSQWNEIESVYLISSPEVSHISGTAVRDIAVAGGSLDGYVKPSALEIIRKIYGGR